MTEKDDEAFLQDALEVISHVVGIFKIMIRHKGDFPQTQRDGLREWILGYLRWFYSDLEMRGQKQIEEMRRYAASAPEGERELVLLTAAIMEEADSDPDQDRAKRVLENYWDRVQWHTDSYCASLHLL